ncbi:response regulator transcription factor [Pedobacter sp. AK017]|uniref:response regulator transcription factor n=1 Tax=Pedobacter sp. AK017 TaxID=2723073 RepID=UPI0016134E23|nr:response regulator transcription factor [Pedobacter sp. AK017]
MLFLKKESMLNLLLAEDHNVVRSGIKKLLEADEAINIVAEAINGAQALELIRDNGSIELLLTDLNMPGINGISLISEVKNFNPNVKVVILSMHDDEKYVAQAFQAGASGYLLKNVDAEEMLFALKYISRGGSYICAALSMSMLSKVLKRINSAVAVAETAIDFSSREIEILELIAEGLTNQEMADRLFISKRTVEGHRQSLTDKTGCRNTAALIRYAMVHDILQ